MANYTGITRTNLFRVNDEAAFRKLTKRIACEDDLIVMEKIHDTQKYFGLACYSTLQLLDEGGEDIIDDIDELYFALQQVLHQEDMIILFEIGHEALRYVAGSYVIITSHQIYYGGLKEAAEAKALEFMPQAKIIY